MILIDTHVWIHWINGNAELRDSQRAAIEAAEPVDLLVHAISLAEVAKLHQLRRVDLGSPLDAWLANATSERLVRVVPVDVATVVEMSRLPGDIHGDPADQILAASARVLGCSLVTSDRKLLAYPHVETIG